MEVCVGRFQIDITNTLKRIKLGHIIVPNFRVSTATYLNLRFERKSASFQKVS